jgi:hypothetical protein
MDLSSNPPKQIANRIHHIVSSVGKWTETKPEYAQIGVNKVCPLVANPMNEMLSQIGGCTTTAPELIDGEDDGVLADSCPQDLAKKMENQGDTINCQVAYIPETQRATQSAVNNPLGVPGRVLMATVSGKRRSSISLFSR